jgi:hypothetical protein
MVRLTLALEESVLERAQSKAQQQGTSVDEVLRNYLESYAGGQRERDRQEAIRTLLDLSSKAQSGSGGRTWTRDDLHER